MKLLISFVTLFLSATFGFAQEMHPHKHDASEKLGEVHFAVSCKPEAQAQFNRAVAWLHSFEYEEAEKAFTEVTVADPQCGMGYWGVAMSNYHQLWVPPTAAELKEGWTAVEKAKTAGARSEREQGYIAAIETFYKDSDKLDHQKRAFAYSDAMKELSAHNPTDREAAVFYALSLVATGMMSHDKTYAREKLAAQILNGVLAREPRHPGVAHYLIHSYDYPALAELALPAARTYAKLAPASAHAQHMPSHIFTRLGLWSEAIKSNLDAHNAAKGFAVRNHMTGVWDEQLHAMDYLVYAYLQCGQDKHAASTLEELNRIQKVEPPTFKVAYAYTAIPARYALERHQWNEAAKLAVPAGQLSDYLLRQFPWAKAHLHYARAIGAARSGDAASARRELEELANIKRRLTEVKGDYDWARQVDIEGQVASAWLAFAEGQREESVRQLRAAADLDDATEKHPVTPGALLPAREQLGELLLELKQPAAALQEFEVSFRSTPNRFNGVYGAAQAARLSGNMKSARMYYIKLLELTRDADTPRPEIAEAKTFLAKHKK